MSISKMSKTIKEVHPNFVICYKVGVFYRCYDKDAYIMSYLFGYNIKILEKDANMIGFPKESLAKVMSKLERMKINYLVIDPRNNYDLDEKSDNKNLNTYDEIYDKAKKYITLKKRIRKIENELMENIEKENIKVKIRKIEEILDED